MEEEATAMHALMKANQLSLQVKKKGGKIIIIKKNKEKRKKEKKKKS